VEIGNAKTSSIGTIDPLRSWADLRTGRDASGERRSRPGPGCRLRSSGLLGVARHSLDVTVDYVKQRWQFGVPVGSFQVVAHKCAEMLYQVAGRGVLRRVGGRCGPRTLEGGCGYRQLRRIQRRRGRHRGGDPGARRRRVYLGGRPCIGGSSERSSTRRCSEAPAFTRRGSATGSPRQQRRGWGGVSAPVSRRRPTAVPASRRDRPLQRSIAGHRAGTR